MSPPSATTSGPDTPSRGASSPTGLIFDWRPVRGGRRRLIFWLAVATGAHLGFFYLFKVVLPPASRSLPPEREALFLAASSPRAERVLRSAQDRVPGLQDRSSLDDPEYERLGALVRDYQPTWKSHVATLRPMPEPDVKNALPSLMSGSAAVLLPELPENPNATGAPARVSLPPSAAPGADSAAPVPPPPAPYVSVLTGLNDRPLLEQPSWPTGIFEENPTDREGAPFMIAVDPQGRVVSCLAMDSPAGLDPERLRPVLLGLRFAPAERETRQWGRIEVKW